MTIDQIFAPSNSGQAYSIQDVLSAVGGQYQPSQMAAPQRSQSIDEVLANLSGRMPQSAAPFKVGAGQYIQNMELAPSPTYTPGEFTPAAMYQNTYAAEIAAGRSEAEARQKAAEMEQKYAIAGSLAGSYFGLPPMVGSTIGRIVAKPVDKVFNSIADVFGW